MTSPTTEAGRDLLDHFGPMPLPDAQELHRRSAMGRRVKLEAAILAIEAEARGELDVAIAVIDAVSRRWMAGQDGDASMKEVYVALTPVLAALARQEAPHE